MTMTVTTWETQAACSGADRAEFFEHAHYGGRTHLWKTICTDCPVRAACLNAAMDAERGAPYRYGIFGGLTPDERQQLAEKAHAGYPPAIHCESTGILTSRSTDDRLTMEMQ